MSDQFYKVEIKGTAKDAHERYPITFDYSQNGTAYFNGCKIHIERDIAGNLITDKVDVRAFNEVAEELAAVTDGTPIHVKGDFGRVKGRGQSAADRYYDVITITEVLSIG